MSTTKDRIKKIKQEIKKMQKDGKDYTLATEGKSIETLAKTESNYKRFLARRKVASERASVVKQMDKIRERRGIKTLEMEQRKTKEKIKQSIKHFKAEFGENTRGKKAKNFSLFRKKYGNDKGIFKNIDKITSRTQLSIIQAEAENIDYVKQFKDNEQEYFKGFMDTYFQMFTGDRELQHRVSMIIVNLYDNPARMRDIVDMMGDSVWKGEYDSDNKSWREDVSNYYVMQDRLERLEKELKLKVDKKIYETSIKQKTKKK